MRSPCSRGGAIAAARLDTHRLRALCDTMLVGTNTIDVDDPLLTVRGADDRPLDRQPLRAVMGLRDLPDAKRDFYASPETVRPRTRDPLVALKELYALDRQHVFLEGGPTLAAAFWKAGLVDEVVTYLAPILLGAGRNAVGDLGIDTITGAAHLAVTDVTVLDPAEPGDDVNVRLTMTPPPVEDPSRLASSHLRDQTPSRDHATHEEA
jgi:diaminohydroxyphosphoribosylaminopyrimidine deaminase/5-amino-6-(5-phosphoribosylamino)uracil reductase